MKHAKNQPKIDSPGAGSVGSEKQRMQDEQMAEHAARMNAEEKWREDMRNGVHHGGVDLNGTIVEFEKQDFFEPGLSFLFPKDFLLCTLETEQQMVYQNEAHALNIILQYTERPEQAIDLRQMKTDMIRSMANMELHTEWLEDGTEEVNGQPIHYCSFLNPVAHGKVFNFLFFVDAGHKRLIANINGNDKHVTRWSIIALEMIRSVEVASA
ncbi:hypothetical protein SAMN04488689_10517 [Paenibacillus sp. cl6col]|uniref:hypothetical protein n=1 Tax=Paenibacillus sp. cl6col TaxID=1761878 RepID=UPI0008900B3C|nr:hypothetical protein [Paenibacillus sp. cl6col]SDF44550.1 hypothetical protein SAMN04488689_10517 [Paenibacillus sp. cl6col]